MHTPNSGLNFLKKEEPVQVKEGFSFLDIMVILCALFVVGFLGYLVINPEKEGAESRNTVRSADLSSILSSLSVYVKDQGTIPEGIPVNTNCVGFGNEICKLGPYDCTNLVDLSVVNSGEGNEIVLSLPSDPLNKSVNGTGYYISQDGEGSVTLCAPYAERNSTISFEKYLY